MPESIEAAHQSFIEAHKAEQRHFLAQFIERHKPEDLPALDFTEEEARIFVPGKLLTLEGLRPKEIKVRLFIPAKKDSCSIFIEDAVGNKIIDVSFQNKIGYFGDKNNKKLPVLYVGGYSDCDLIRDKGVTADFYRNLDMVATQIGFEVVAGENTFRNVEYFIRKLGRYPEAFLLGRQDLNPLDGLGDQDYCLTYGFLAPNNIKLAVRPEYLSDQSWRNNVRDILWPPFNLETGRGCIRYEKYRKD